MQRFRTHAAAIKIFIGGFLGAGREKLPADRYDCAFKLSWSLSCRDRKLMMIVRVSRKFACYCFCCLFGRWNGAGEVVFMYVQIFYEVRNFFVEYMYDILL